MENKRENMIRKIKKLMAIANDPGASDQEIQTSTYRANKLMIQYKIEQIELMDEKNKNEKIIEYKFSEKYLGYLYWTLFYISKNCGCKCYYVGRFNSKCDFGIYGFKSDIEICIEMAKPVLDYIEQNLIDIKNSYIGTEDFRIFKRDYCKGFASGIQQQLRNAFIENKEAAKYEVMLTTFHPMVLDYGRNQLNIKKGSATTNLSKTRSQSGYTIGLKEGSSYNLDNSDRKNKRLEG